MRLTNIVHDRRWSVLCGVFLLPVIFFVTVSSSQEGKFPLLLRRVASDSLLMIRTRQPSAQLSRLHIHTMAKVVLLHQIPTLRELYKREAIAASPGEGRDAHFPFSSTLLDRVSV